METVPRRCVNPASDAHGKYEGVNELYRIISATPGQRTPALAEGLRTSSKNIERCLKQLRDEGKVEFRGAPKTGGYWSL